MGLEPGQELSVGDEVVEVLRGGFSEVAILRGPLGVRAMKRLRDDVRLAGGSAMADQFVRECLIWSQKLAEAPYVARALLPVPKLDDLGPVLFMEYVQGGSLQRLLGKQRRLAVSQVARLWSQMGRALEYAHHRGVVHRDLKPNNVLLDRRGDVRLIDWGVSSALDAAGLGAVTPYCAPERMSDPSLVEPSDDVYMLGVMMIEALCGHLPDHGSLARALEDIVREGGVPPAITSLATAMIATPAERPTAAEVVVTLESEGVAEEARARDRLKAFCSACAFVSHSVVRRCPLCASPMRRRTARAVPAGMIRIPAGTYARGLSREQARLAGAAAGMAQMPDAELAKLVQPTEAVFVDAFDIDSLPVTNARYAEFCIATRYPEPDGLAANKDKSPDHPVTGLGWKDALCFALWAGNRLPSQSEWEKAARGPDDGRAYPWGNEWDARRCNHSRFVEVQTTTPVGHFTAGDRDGRSPYGVADLAGNVAEWVADDAPFGKILKGGNYGQNGAIYSLVSFVMNGEIDLRSNPTGVRCARDVEYDEGPVE